MVLSRSIFQTKKSLHPVSGTQASMPDVLSVFVTAGYPRSEYKIVYGE